MPPGDDEWTFPNRATPLGSPAYYAVRFSPEALRERYALLFAWQHLIEEIADRPHDPGVARIKLDWWRGEIATLDNGRPRHPVAVALAGHAVGERTVAHMIDVVQAAEQSILAPQPHDQQSFADSCRGVHGQFFAALAAATPSQPDEPQPCVEAGAYCAAVERIRQLARRPHRVPVNAGVDALSGMSDEQRTHKLDGLIGQFAVPPPGERRALPTVLRCLVALSNATHQKLRRKGYPVLDTLIDRPPIAHLWTAWRSR